jgi:hypothetical protein
LIEKSNGNPPASLIHSSFDRFHSGGQSVLLQLYELTSFSASTVRTGVGSKRAAISLYSGKNGANSRAGVGIPIVPFQSRDGDGTLLALFCNDAE